MIKTESSVTMTTAGSLRRILILNGELWTVTSLKITGPLNGDDIICLRQMLRCTKEKKELWGMLSVLDLCDAFIVIGGDSYCRSYSCATSKYLSYTTSNDVIGNYMFEDCTELKMIVLPKGVTSIRSGAFDGCTSLTEVTFPNSVTEIDDYAFYCCSGLTQLTIPNSVTSIGWRAFKYCSGLTEVIIPNSVTHIGSEAFRECRGLTQVTIGESVTMIGIDAFYGCTKLTKFEVAEDNKLFFDDDGVLYSNDMGRLIQFPIASPITLYNILEGVKKIGNHAFEGFYNLKEVTIPESVTWIGHSAFYGCTGLTRVTIPNSVTMINDFAFYNCSELTRLTIGERVASIGYLAFDGCTSIKSIASLNSEPPKCYGIGFEGVRTSISVLYVPKGSKEAYSTADTWKKFTNIVEI